MAIIVPKINSNDFEYIDCSSTLRNSIEKFISEWNNSSKTLIAKTSGSTGKPKEIVLSKEKMLLSAQKTAEYFNFQQNGTIALALSSETIGGKMQIVRSLIKNQKLVILPNSRNPVIKLNKEINFLTLVPLQLEAILNENPEKLKLIKHILLGGASISAKLKEEIRALNSSFYEGYGMTETYSHIALKKINAETNFQTLPEVVISKSEKGTLILDVPYLEIYKLETNDLADIKSPTEFKIQGRADFVINSGGLKFSPEVLEEKLSQDIKSPFFIFGKSDAKFGDKICIAIEGKEDKNLNLQGIFKEKLSKYEIPKEVFYLAEFIRTESGKVNRIQSMAIIS